jgi:DNA-binding NtrC family response regulator
MPTPVLDETIQDRRGSSEPAPQPRFSHLFLALECSRPCAGGARYTLTQIDEVLIARGATRRAERLTQDGVRRLVVQVPDGRISGRHACLRRRGEGWEFEDLGSRNGSCIDGRPTSGRTQLSDRSVIEVGHTFLIFRSGLPTPAETLGDQDSSTLAHTSPGLRTLLPDLAAGFGTLARIARSAVPVLLLGETGSGKELLARAVHAQSERPGTFVAVNCGAIPDSLMEAHFFGHVRGAFSGASRDEPGLVRAAHRGSLFLDEIAELPHVSQTALLRVLQEQEVVPVGGTQPVAVDVRIVAATHAPLEELVNAGKFRNDLFARIAGFRFVIPPLRERLEDFGIFVAHLLQDLVADQSAPLCFEPEATRALLSYGWPRNLRELKQCLASATALADGHTIHRTHLALPSQARPAASAPSAPPANARTHDQLRDELLAHFQQCGGNVSEVARRMGKARVQIQRWMARYGIDPAQFK